MHTSPLPKRGLLRWELGLALMIKVILLIGLWLLIFRWQDRPASKPDIAERFALPAQQAHSYNPPEKETAHVR